MSSNMVPRVIKEMEGVWRGEGSGVYPPRVGTFHYIEELIVTRLAKANTWEIKSSTKHRETGKAMHSEVGYIRCHPIDEHRGDIEFCLIHAFGVSEVSHGTYDNMTIVVHSDEDGLTRAASAKEPYTTGVRRHYDIKLDEGREGHSGRPYLHFKFDMATTDTPIQNHLDAKLYKVDE